MLDLRTGNQLTRRETIKGGLGLAAILAAGKAPAMLLGARGVAFGAWKNPYVTDGLVAMWDGIWNKSGGVHDSSATTWADLSGSGNDLTCRTTGLFTDNALYCDGNLWSAYRSGRVYYTTVECVFKTKSFVNQSQASAFIMMSGNNTREIDTGELRPTSYEAGIPNNTVNFYEKNSVTVKSSLINNNGSVHQVCCVYNDNLDGMPKSCYANASISEHTTHWNWGVRADTTIGDRDHTQASIPWNGWVYAIRLYDRALSASEILSNYQVDQRRFNIPAQ